MLTHIQLTHVPEIKTSLATAAWRFLPYLNSVRNLNYSPLAIHHFQLYLVAYFLSAGLIPIQINLENMLLWLLYWHSTKNTPENIQGKPCLKISWNFPLVSFLTSLLLLYMKLTECLSFYVCIYDVRVCVCICMYVYFLLEDFYHEEILNFSNAFSALIEILMCFLTLILFVFYIKFINLHM